MNRKRRKASEDFRDPDELMLDYVMRMYYEKETERLLAEIEEEAPNPEAEAFFAEYENEHYKVIDKNTRLHRKRLRSKQLLLARLAALATIVVLIFNQPVIAANELKKTPLKLVITDYGYLSTIDFAKNELVNLDIPDGWQGNYYFSYIPEGYSLYDMDHMGNIEDFVEFRTKDTRKRLILQINNGYYSCITDKGATSIDFDTEYARVWREVINGTEYLFVNKFNRNYVYWIDGICLLHVFSSDLSEDEFRAVVQGVVRVKP